MTKAEILEENDELILEIERKNKAIDRLVEDLNKVAKNAASLEEDKAAIQYECDKRAERITHIKTAAEAIAKVHFDADLSSPLDYQDSYTSYGSTPAARSAEPPSVFEKSIRHLHQLTL